MSAKYDLYKTPDIKETGEAQPLHPRIVSNGTIDKDEFLDRVHLFTGMSRSLLSGALESFQSELHDLLARGYNVELGELGFFSISLQGPPIMDKKEVHAQSIHLKNINFRASKTFKRAVYQKLQLERSKTSPSPTTGRLNEKECLQRIDSHLEKYPVITRADYCRLTGLRKEYALQDLNNFIEQGLLIRFGGGKQVFYAKSPQKD